MKTMTRVWPHDQNKTVAARAMADRKIMGHLSYRVATLRQSFNRPNMFSILWRLRQILMSCGMKALRFLRDAMQGSMLLSFNPSRNQSAS